MGLLQRESAALSFPVFTSLNTIAEHVCLDVLVCSRICSCTHMPHQKNTAHNIILSPWLVCHVFNTISYIAVLIALSLECHGAEAKKFTLIYLYSEIEQ